MLSELCAGWTQADGQIRSPKEGEREIVTILRRFHFSSSLKRMSCIVKARPCHCTLSPRSSIHPAELLVPVSLARRADCRCLLPTTASKQQLSLRLPAVAAHGRMQPAPRSRALCCHCGLRVISVQVDRGSSSGARHYVIAKGAPEVLLDHLASAPAEYAAVYKRYAAQGAR